MQEVYNMKNYFFQNQISQLDYVPKGYVVSESYHDRMTCFVPLSDEQEAYLTANPTANSMQVYYCGNVPQPEIILPTLEEMQEKLKADLLVMVKEIGSMLLSAKEIVGETATYLYLKDQCNQMREQTLQSINTLPYEQLSQFAIREEDAKPLKDAINALILS